MYCHFGEIKKHITRNGGYRRSTGDSSALPYFFKKFLNKKLSGPEISARSPLTLKVHQPPERFERKERETPTSNGGKKMELHDTTIFGNNVGKTRD